MMVSAQHIQGLPIISLSGEGQVALSRRIIVDPATCKIILIEAIIKTKLYFIAASDIRDYSHSQLIVNSLESLSLSEDLIRYQAEIKNPTTLFGYRIITVSGSRLGRCHDYIFDTQTGAIVKLYVQASIFRRFLTNHFIIDANDIVKINHKTIQVRDALSSQKSIVKVKEPLPAKLS